MNQEGIMRYVTTRFLGLIPTLLVLITIAFFLIRSAAAMPVSVPMTKASTMANPPMVADTGKPRPINSLTDQSLYWNEGPISPVMIWPR